MDGSLVAAARGPGQLAKPAGARDRALQELARHGLVERGRPRTLHRFEGFKLLSDSGDGTAYTVPGDSRRAALYLPPTFFLNGWHLVLEPREIATWLMLYELASYHTGRAKTVSASSRGSAGVGTGSRARPMRPIMSWPSSAWSSLTRRCRIGDEAGSP